MGIEDVAHADLVNGVQTALHSHAGGGGGVVSYYAESPGLNETSATSWQEKLTYVVELAGDYLVQWTFELSGDAINYHVRSQVLHNAVELANVQFEPEDVAPDYWLSGAGFRKLTLGVGDSITINYCSEGSSIMTRIRYAAICLIKL